MRQTMTMSDGNIIVNCDEPINGYQQFVFSPGTIASWTALLGLGSTAEAVAAIMQGVEDTTRYDPSTGRGVWTEAYEALEAALNDSAADLSMLADDVVSGLVNMKGPPTVRPKTVAIGVRLRPRRLRRWNRHRHVLR